jgi:hypothetical protein
MSDTTVSHSKKLAIHVDLRMNLLHYIVNFIYISLGM